MLLQLTNVRHWFLINMFCTLVSVGVSRLLYSCGFHAARAMSKTDARKIDALDQWCLRMLLGIRWYQFVWNDDVRRLTQQPKLTAIIQSCRLTLFGHIMRMDDKCQEDPVGPPSGRLEKTTGSSRHHMAQHHPTGSETSPSYASRSSRFGSEPPSVEDNVDVWRYATVSCLPETTIH